ncbi:MAG: lipocalin family protein [Arcticibacter sp.]
MKYFIGVVFIITFGCNRPSDVELPENISQSVIGSWVEPNPINELEVQGFELRADGSAASINMATLLYQSWWSLDDSLFLMAQSIGNGNTSTDTLSYQIIKCDEDSLLLGNGMQTLRMTKRKK